MPLQSIRRPAGYLKGHNYSTHFVLSILCVISAGVFASSVSAKTSAPQTGSIKGKVVADIPDQRRILGGVNVTLGGNLLADKKLQTLSDEEGFYSFTGLTAGDY